LQRPLPANKNGKTETATAQRLSFRYVLSRSNIVTCYSFNKTGRS